MCLLNELYSIVFYFPELEMLVKCNNIESENILSSVKINTNHRLTQSKVSHILKDEHIPGFYY